jgi:hypothetical protein
VHIEEYVYYIESKSIKVMQYVNCSMTNTINLPQYVHPNNLCVVTWDNFDKSECIVLELHRWLPHDWPGLCKLRSRPAVQNWEVEQVTVGT